VPEKVPGGVIEAGEERKKEKRELIESSDNIKLSIYYVGRYLSSSGSTF